jgi:sulfoxide reductase heme-binding subunit YedZ
VVLKSVVWTGCLLPVACLVYWYWTDDLTANPIDFITDTLGDWALRLLLASLALTPLRIVTAMAWQMTLRRLLGLFAFFYVALHFGVWIGLDHFFDWRQMGADIAKRPYITAGVAAFTLLLPLAATSTTGMIKRMGALNWRRLHRLVYVAATLAILHYVWLAKKVLLAPWIYAAILALLLAIRGWEATRRYRRRRHATTAVVRPVSAAPGD